jgi:hypothetical protein
MDPARLARLARRALLVLCVVTGACKAEQKSPAHVIAEPGIPPLPPGSVTVAVDRTHASGGGETGGATGTAEPEGEQKIVSTAANDTGTAAAATNAGATEENEPEEAAPEPRRVLILGDSLAATAFGVLLEKRLDAHPHVVCFRRAKSATGLARPDYFDWMRESRRQVELRKPDLVIVIIGGNDGQDLTNRKKKGGRVRWKDPGWEQAYRRRVQEFLVGITAPERRILWVGLPRMGLRSFERKLHLIRTIQQDAVTGMGDAGVYLDTAPFFTDEHGALLQEARVRGRRRPQAIRADDGIHFTMAGSRYFADRVYPEVLVLLGLEQAG